MRLLFIVLITVTTSLQADPKSHYMIHCMGCHLADGQGMPPDVPAFNEQLGRMITSDAGRAYLVRVPGAAQSLINNQELAEVINWMLYQYSASSLPDDFEPYTGAEVTGYRTDTLSDPTSFRSTLPGIGKGS